MNIQSIIQNYDIYLDSNALLSAVAHPQAKVFFEQQLVPLLKSHAKKLYISKDFDSEIQQTILSGSARSRFAQKVIEIMKLYQASDVVINTKQSFFTIVKQSNGQKKLCFIANMPQLGATLVNVLRNNKKTLPTELLDSLIAYKFNRHGQIENWFNPTSNHDLQIIEYFDESVKAVAENNISKGPFLSNFAKDHLIFFDSTSLLASMNHDAYKAFFAKDLPKILKETDQKLYLSKNVVEGLERALELLNRQMEQEQNLSQGLDVYRQRIINIEKAHKLVDYYLKKDLAIQVDHSPEEMLQQVISYERPSIFIFNNPQLFLQLQLILKNASQNAKEEIHLAKMMKHNGSLDILAPSALDDIPANAKKLTKSSTTSQSNASHVNAEPIQQINTMTETKQKSSEVKEQILSSIIPNQNNNESLIVSPQSQQIVHKVPETVLATQTLSIREIVKYFKLFFDTSALVHSAKTFHTQSFLTQELPYALYQSRNKAIIPVKVLDELEKLTKHTEMHTRQNAQKIFSIVQMYLSCGIAELKGDDADTFPDHIFQVIFTRYRLTHNLLLITNDHNLAIDLLNVSNSLSVQSHKSIKLFRFVDSPPDIIKDWQEILNGDPKLHLNLQNQPNLSIFNIQTNKDSVYRQLKKQISNWNNID